MGECSINKVVKKACQERDNVQRLEKTVQAEKIEIARYKYEVSKYYLIENIIKLLNGKVASRNLL